MGVITYHKLVRDRIPEIIAKAGKKCRTRTLGDEEYLDLLDAKLSEELAEYQADKSMEELADLLEVIHAVAAARGFGWDELEKCRLHKADERGGFEKQILLEEVRE